MVQLPWSLNALPCDPCCGDDTDCRNYFPCFIRNMRFFYAGLVEEEDPLDPGNPPVGTPLTQAVVKRVTVENLTNAQVSADWSTWNVINSQGAGGIDTAEFRGLPDQGCTFGIDVSTTDWFCGLGFRVRIEICNDTDDPIWFSPSHGNVSLAISFEDLNRACTVPLLTAEPSVPLEIAPATSIEFILDFGTANAFDSGCYGDCYDPSSGSIILEDANVDGIGDYFIDRVFNTRWDLASTCLLIETCVPEPPQSAFPGASVSTCVDLLCPPGGCITDLPPPIGVSDCACGCSGIEAMNNCAPPKEALSGDSDSGSVQICESSDDGIGVGETIIQIRNLGCKRVGSIDRPGLLQQFSFSLIGVTVGAGVVIDLALEDGDHPPHCAGYKIRWGVTEDVIFIEVDGFREENTVPLDYVPIASGGIPYLIAPANPAGIAFSSDIGVGAMTQFDDDEMTFFDDIVMENI